MRFFLKLFGVFLVLFVVIGFWRGWFAFSESAPDPENKKMNVNVSVDKEKMKADIKKAEERVEKRIEKIEDRLKTKKTENK